jgi:hypothetical protein
MDITCGIRLHTAKSPHDSNRRGIYHWSENRPGLRDPVTVRWPSSHTHMDFSCIHQMIKDENAPALPEEPHTPGERHGCLPDSTLARSTLRFLGQADYAL